MKKILFWIFSAALSFSATAVAPQTAQKLGEKAPVFAAQAQTAPAKTARFHVAKSRSFVDAAQQLSHARSSALGLKTATDKAPVRALAAGESWPNLVGLVGFNNSFTQDNAPVGVYQVLNGSTNLQFTTAGDGMYGAVLMDGVYYIQDYVDYGFLAFVYRYAYDYETGERLAQESGDIIDLCPGGMALDPTTGIVYGIGYNAAGDGLCLKSFALDGTTLAGTEIAPISGNWNSLMCDAQGQLYGISYEGQSSDGDYVVTKSTLNKIDKATAAVTFIGETGLIPQYLSSATIDTKTGKCYWNVCLPDETAIIAEVNLTTGAATKLCDLALDDEIFGLTVAQAAAEDGAPATVEMLSALFQNGSLTGKINFKSPTTTFDGTAASGALAYKILANGDALAEGNTTFGADNAIDVTVPAAGEYTFTVTVSNSVGASPKAKVTTFVGNGVPEAPEATLVYENGNMNLSWDAVTATVDGGYIDAAAVTYTVTRFPGEVVVANNIAVTAFSEAIDVPAEITTYYYTVVAHSAGLDSEVATSNSVTMGSIVPPYFQDFDDATTALGGWTIIDANDDGRTWTINQGQLRVQYNSSKAMDDWAILPPLALEAGKAYHIYFDARANGTSFPERVEAKVGKAATAAAMTTTLVPATNLTSSDYVTLGDFFVPETDGIYYVGIHGISDEDEYYLYIDNVGIDAGVATTAPGLCTDIVLTPDANGELKAYVAFKAPAVDFANAALTANMTKVEISRDGELVKTFNNVEPGEELEFEDNTITEGGNVTYSFVAFNASGSGKVATATTFIGVDAPAAPENITMVENGNTGLVTLSWDAVNKDQNGNTINPALVTYTVCDYVNGSWVAVAGCENLTTPTAQIQAVAAGEQDFVQYAVFAITSGGNNGAAGPFMPVGTPYNGIQETFENGTLGYIWGISSSQNASWSIYMSDNDLGVAGVTPTAGFVAMQAQYLEESGEFYSGKVTVPATDPGLRFATFNIIGENGAADINEVVVKVREAGVADWTVLATTTVSEICGDTEGWGYASYSLSAYAGKTVQVALEATVKKYAYTMFTDIKVGALVAQDLVAANIQAPLTVKAGEEYAVDVTVRNGGMQDATAFSVELYAGSELVDTKTAESLVAGASQTFSFNRTMSPVATASTVYTAKVVYAADMDQTNNSTAEVAVAPKFSTLPVAANLKGEQVAEGVKLTWAEPNLEGGATEEVTETFEDADSWAHELAGWTFLDEDGSAVGGFQNTEIPGITVGQSTASFFIFDSSLSQFNQTFGAHSGDKYLASLFRYDDGTVSDWAISPALSGNAQTISLYAKSYSSTYPEAIDLCYSTTGTDVADFQVVKSVNPVPGEWTLVEFDVPAGATYFAIHSKATGSFMLMIDDVTYERGSATAHLTLKGYDVYRDGEKLATVEETEYVDNTTTEGNHEYAVVVVYETGISAPETVTVDVSGVDAISAAISIKATKGAIIVTGAEGKQIVVNAVDGRTVFAAEGDAVTTVNVGTGIYLVKAADKVAKVIVR